VLPAGSKQKRNTSTRNTAKRKAVKQQGADDHDDEDAPAEPPLKAKSKAQKGPSKGRRPKVTSRVGLVDPTAEEMKTAFSMFNPHDRSVISSQDISRVSTSHVCDISAVILHSNCKPCIMVVLVAQPLYLELDTIVSCSV